MPGAVISWVEFWDLHDGNSIVVEDGRNIFRRKLVRGVADQQTGLSHGTIADHDTSNHHHVSC